jgi:hypothetical protein
MRLISGEEGLGCQSVYRVIVVMNGDLDYYNRGNSDYDIDAVLTGIAAVAEHADRRGIPYQTDTKDVDLWTFGEQDDLERLLRTPLAEMSGDEMSQINYDTTSASTASNAPEAFVDIITDYEQAFGWNPEDAREVEQELSEQTTGQPIIEGQIDVHLPELETLRKTFEYSDRDYTDRIELIDSMM